MPSVLVVAALEEEIHALRKRHPSLSILVTGPGKVLAAARLAAALAATPVEEVVVLGTAGALGVLPGVHEVGTVSQHDFDGVAIRELVSRSFGEPIVLGNGVHLATGDVFVADPAHVAALVERGYGLVDMEGYAYALACADADVPVRIVKAVSDGADAEAASSWSSAVARCAEELADWYDASYGAG